MSKLYVPAKGEFDPLDVRRKRTSLRLWWIPMFVAAFAVGVLEAPWESLAIAVMAWSAVTVGIRSSAFVNAALRHESLFSERSLHVSDEALEEMLKWEDKP